MNTTTNQSTKSMAAANDASDLEQARALLEKGMDQGIFGGDYQTAKSTFQQAWQLTKDANVSSLLEKQQQVLLIEILYQHARLENFFQYGPHAKKMLYEAITLHEALCSVSQSTRGIHKNKKNHEHSLLLVNIYTAFSVAESICDMGEPPKWTHQGLELMQQIQTQDETRAATHQAQNSWAILLSFQGFDANTYDEKIQACLQSIAILERLVQEHPRERLYLCNLARTLRITSYVYREKERLEEAKTVVLRSKQVAQQGLDAWPLCQVYRMEYFRCCCAVSSLYVEQHQAQGTLANELRTSRKDEVVAAQVLPHSAFHLSCLGDALFRLARVEKEQGLKEDSQVSVIKAMQVFDRFVEMEGADRARQYEYYTALVETATISREIDEKSQALQFFVRAHDYFLHTLWKEQEECPQEELEHFVIAMCNSFECSKESESVESGHRCLQSTIQMGPAIKLRKNQVKHAENLMSLGESLLECEDKTSALRVYKQLILFLEPLYQLHPWHCRISRAYGRAYLGMAKATDNETQEIEARQAFLRQQQAFHGKDYKDWTTVPLGSTSHSPEFLQQLRAKCEDVPMVVSLFVPCTVEGKSSIISVRVFFGEAIPDKDPLEDFTRFIKEDYQATLTDSICSAIQTLHKLALKNNESFQELLDWTLLSDNENNNILETPFPNNFYDRDVWYRHILEQQAQSNHILPAVYLQKPILLLTKSLYNVVEIYGNFPMTVYRALKQVIDPLFEAEEYDKEIVQLLRQAGVEENRPGLITYADSLEILRWICFGDEKEYQDKFSSAIDYAGMPKVIEIVTQLAKAHILEVRRMIKNRVEPQKYNYTREIPSSLLESTDKLAMECSICAELVDSTKKSSYMMSPCNHLFHKECLTQWMAIRMACPLCRQDLPPKMDDMEVDS